MLRTSASNQKRDEGGRYSFEVDTELTDGDVASEVLFMNPAQRPQEVANRGPHAFNRIDVNLADTIAIVIPSPFLVRVTDGDMGSNDMVVALPFIGIDRDPNLGEGVNLFFQGFLVGMINHPQPDLAALATNRAHNRRAVISIGAVSTLFVGAGTRRVVWVAVIVTFFPPRSETSHRFQSDYHLRRFGVVDVGHWLVFPGGFHAPFVG